MTETGWKTANTITQDIRDNVVNGGSVKPFRGLNDLKNTDKEKYAYINKFGVCDYRASAIVYFNTFNFNIPDNATIDKVRVRIVCREDSITGNGLKMKLLKLKTGASTTDGGVGTSNINTGRWASKPSWSTITIDKTPSQWGLTIKPSTVNSSNFGCVFQCMGLGDGTRGFNTWSLPQIAYLQMSVVYTEPSKETEVENAKFTVQVDSPSGSLDIQNPDTSVNLVVKYVHQKGANGKYNAGNTPTVMVDSGYLKIGSTKTPSFTATSFSVKESGSSQTYTSSIPLYPGIVPGVHYIRVRSDGFEKYVSIRVDDSSFANHIFIDFAEYEDPGQTVILDNCNFQGNAVNGDFGQGGACYIYTGHHVVKNNNSYSGNDAHTCSRVWLNGECK